MSVDLKYKHQRKTFELMKDALKAFKRAAYIFPMGGGKSFPPLKYMEENPDKKVLFVSPNIGIINQFKRYISKYLLDGKRVTKNTYRNFRAITYQKISLAQDLSDFKPDVIIFDEIHRMGAENWEPAIDRLIQANPDAEIIGMSATPERTDKRNMAYEKFGKNVIYEMSLTEALSGSKENEVVLNGARYSRVLSELKGELNQYKEQIESLDDKKSKQRLLRKFEELNSIVSNSPDIADIMKDSMKKKNGKYIVFCKNREEMFEKMENVQAIFGKVNNNIKVDYVISKKDGKGKSQRENRKTIEEFEAREKTDALNLLFCVDMLNEGVHIEGLDGEIQFKPTNSKIRYKQMVGRVLSTDKLADETVIVDAVNNWIRQIDTYMELQGAVNRGSRVKGAKGDYDKTQDTLRLTDEELELLDVLKEIREELNYNSKNTFDDVIQWLETHDGNLPRGNISRNGKTLKTDELTEDEHDERSLYLRWLRSDEKRILDEYAGVPISEFPKELEEYVDKIELLRSYGLGTKVLSAYEEIIQWLETHDGKMPRASISENNRKLRIEDLTDEEKREINLYGRWQGSREYRALKACEGIELEEFPEEYIEYKEKIATLRSYGLGIKPKTVYEEIIDWLNGHDGEMPHGSKMKKGIVYKVEDLTEEEQYERNLYARWNRSKEREALEACKGIDIDNLPEEYIKFKDQIEELRKYGLGKSTYEELLHWLTNNNGKMPRGMIAKNGRRLKTNELSKEEQYERNLYYRVSRLPEFIAFKKTKGIPIDDLPEEFIKYKKQIILLRKFEEEKIEEDILNQMKSSVGKHVGSNSDTREELSSLSKKLEENKGEKK